MKPENKFIYYGILFYFLYFKIYSIVSEVLTLPVLIMRWSIHLIPVFLLLFVAILSILFYRIQKFPIIRIWFVLLVVFLASVVNIFSLPYRIYLLGGDSLYSLYGPKIQSTIMDYMFYCGVVNTFVFLAISYFKYVKIQKNDKFHDYADDAE